MRQLIGGVLLVALATLLSTKGYCIELASSESVTLSCELLGQTSALSQPGTFANAIPTSGKLTISLSDAIDSRSIGAIWIRFEADLDEGDVVEFWLAQSELASGEFPWDVVGPERVAHWVADSYSEQRVLVDVTKIVRDSSGKKGKKAVYFRRLDRLGEMADLIFEVDGHPALFFE